jgi:hypothetical protein
MKDEAGAGFTITLPSALRRMGSWWPNGAVFFPPLARVKWTYPSPKCHPNSVLGARPVRVERHNPWSIASLFCCLSLMMSNGLISGVFVGCASNSILPETHVLADLQRRTCGNQVPHAHQIVSGSAQAKVNIQCTLQTPRCRTLRISAIVFSQPKHSSIRLLFF